MKMVSKTEDMYSIQRNVFRLLHTAYCCTITFPVAMVMVAEPPAPVAVVVVPMTVAPPVGVVITATGALVAVVEE